MEAMMSSLLPQQRFAVSHISDISAARRYGQQLADALHFDEVRSGRLAILITEVATNILKHAGEGALYILHSQAAQIVQGELGTQELVPAVDVLAMDHGPGMLNMSMSFRDGVSTSGTSGNGLGALRRLSDEFDAYSMHAKGSVFFMRVWQRDLPAVVSHQASLQFGGLCLPLTGEDVCGDAWAFNASEAQSVWMMSDGLGHGVLAAAASELAVKLVQERPDLGVTALIKTADEVLHSTRGAAMAACTVDLSRELLQFAGIGNVSACVTDGRESKLLLSHSGIVGNKVRKIQQFEHAFASGSMCIMHSDGINTQWDLEDYPGLFSCHPLVIAGVLLRDFQRGRDDASVLVVRRA
jgi:anti-sigma regulatory factor (Ser/Thr protein kinase)